MEIKLIVAGGKKAGQEIAVDRPDFVIGRAEGSPLQLRSDRVSRRHCEIILKEGYVAVRDLGSKNGTFVNDEKLEPGQERQLKTDDRLRVGPMEFTVHLEVSVGGKKKPKVRSVQEAAARTVAAAGDDDLDISEWLEEDEKSKSGKVYVHPKAGVLRFKTDEDTITTTRDRIMEKFKKGEKAKVVGQFTDGKKDKEQMAESSEAAARAMLNKLMKGQLEE